MKFQWILAVLFLAFNTEVPRLNARTLEQNFVHNVAYAIGQYIKLNEGKWPSRWEHLDPFIVLKSASRALPVPLDERYMFLEKGRLFISDYEDVAPESPGGYAIMIGKAPIRERERNKAGRYVIWKSGEDCLYKWLNEDEVQKLLNPKNPTITPKETVKPHLTLALELMPPDGSLVVGEPVCILVKAQAKEAEIPSTTDFIFEVSRDKAKHTLEFLEWCFLEDSLRPAEVNFSPTPSKELAARFHAVLLLDMDCKPASKDAAKAVALTAVPGDYEIKIKEKTSGCESPPVRFKVAAGSKEDAAATEMFISKEGLAALLLDGLNSGPSYGQWHPSAYDKLLKRCPNSRLAAYASMAAGRAKYVSLRSPVDREKGMTTEEYIEYMKGEPERCRQIAALTPYFDRTLALKFPSLFEAKAMYYKAQCQWAGGQYDAVRATLTELVNKYGGTAGVREVTEAAAFLQRFDEERSAMQESRKQLGLH